MSSIRNWLKSRLETHQTYHKVSNHVVRSLLFKLLVHTQFWILHWFWLHRELICYQGDNERGNYQAYSFWNDQTYPSWKGQIAYANPSCRIKDNVLQLRWNSNPGKWLAWCDSEIRLFWLERKRSKHKQLRRRWQLQSWFFCWQTCLRWKGWYPNARHF